MRSGSILGYARWRRQAKESTIESQEQLSRFVNAEAKQFAKTVSRLARATDPAKRDALARRAAKLWVPLQPVWETHPERIVAHFDTDFAVKLFRRLWSGFSDDQRRKLQLEAAADPVIGPRMLLDFTVERHRFRVALKAEFERAIAPEIEGAAARATHGRMIEGAPLLAP